MPDSLDLSGLPIYYVNKWISKRMDDGTVMVVCGLQIGEQWNPLYVAVTSAKSGVIDAANYIREAEDAFNEAQLVPDGLTAH